MGMAMPPVSGNFTRYELWPHVGLDFVLEDGCRYGLWPRPELANCLRGAWVAVAGASNTAIWAVQLANTLVPGALHTKRDNFSIDGVFTQLIDVIIEDGRVVYKKILVDERVKSGNRIRAHDYTREHTVLAGAFGNVSDAPRYSSGAIRITSFLAEYWDSVPLALEAMEVAESWAEAEATIVVSIADWYVNNLICGPRAMWCATRPEYQVLKQPKQIVAQAVKDMRKVVPKLHKFCSAGGRAGKRGCAITTIQHCKWMHKEIWPLMRESVMSVMEREATKLLRLVDLWTLTQALPDVCLGVHQSPLSTLWLWQVLLSGICSAAAAPASNTVAMFVGPTCDAESTHQLCGNFSKLGFAFAWECAVSEACDLRATTPPTPLDVAGASVARAVHECDLYMEGKGCNWTLSHSCPGQRNGSIGMATDDGTIGYHCCCERGMWTQEQVVGLFSRYGRVWHHAIGHVHDKVARLLVSLLVMTIAVAACYRMARQHGSLCRPYSLVGHERFLA